MTSLTDPEDQFWDKAPPRVAMPAIIPVQALNEDAAGNWEQPKRFRIPGKVAVFLLAIILGGVGLSVAVRSGPLPLKIAAQPTSGLPTPNRSAITLSPSQPLSPSAASSSSPTPAQPAASCSLPITANPDLGFAIGLPAGWSARVAGGMIALSPQDETKERVTSWLWPLALTDTALAEMILESVRATLVDEMRRQGGSMAIDEYGRLTGTQAGTPIEGFVTSEVQGKELLITGGWAPQTDWTKQELIIRGLQKCYRRTSAPALKEVVETVTDASGTTSFQLGLPSTWQLAGLTSAGFDLEAGNGSVAVRLRTTQGSLGSLALPDLVSQSFQTGDFTEVKLTSQSAAAEQIDARGFTWQTQASHFEARWNDQPIQGVISAAVSNEDYGYGYGTHATFVIIEQAEKTRWSAVADLTSAVSRTLRLLDPEPGQGLAVASTDPARAQQILGAQAFAAALEPYAPTVRPLLGTYLSAEAANSQTYWAPLVNYEPVTQRYRWKKPASPEELTLLPKE